MSLLKSWGLSSLTTSKTPDTMGVADHLGPPQETPCQVGKCFALSPTCLLLSLIQSFVYYLFISCYITWLLIINKDLDFVSCKSRLVSKDDEIW